LDRRNLVRSNPYLTGLWEREGRNPLVGTFLLIFAVGAIYFLVQALVLNGVILLDAARRGSAATDVYARYRWLILGVLAATQYGLLLGLPLLVIRRWHTPRLARYLRIGRFHLPGVIVTTVGTVALLPLVDLIAQYLYSLVPGLESLDTGTGSLLIVESAGEQVLVYLAIAVTPAICEEMLFRAYFQRTLERRVSAPWHFLISGSVFALFHQQVLTLPSLVIVGVFLSYMYFAFQSPWTTVAGHFAYNGIQVFLVNYGQPIRGVISEDGFGKAALLAGTGIAIAAVLFAEATRRRGHDGNATIQPPAPLSPE
jgi:membrane protease YdiL (CAAX protease family)